MNRLSLKIKIKTAKKERCGKDEDVEKTLKKWFIEGRDKNVPVIGALLKTKAEDLAIKLGRKEFKAMDGWLTRWLQRENCTIKFSANFMVNRPKPRRKELNTGFWQNGLNCLKNLNLVTFIMQMKLVCIFGQCHINTPATDIHGSYSGRSLYILVNRKPLIVLTISYIRWRRNWIFGRFIS